VINQERETGQPLLVLDAGNSLMGDQNPALATEGKSTVEAMNRMRYDAMALGPSDLELGMAALKDRIAEAEFAILSANAVASATQALVADPYIIEHLSGVDVAIVGITGGAGTEEIEVKEPLSAARSMVTRLADQVEVIILLSHAGASIDQEIAEAVPGIDVIISGGSFKTLPLQLGSDVLAPWVAEGTGTLQLHADQGSPGHAGRNMGVAHLMFDTEGNLINKEWRRLSLGPEIADDPSMLEWVQAQTALIDQY
jgi:2',3'-cyclic-nucleotide 2'-phosphodiesterase (5'-nucleotidase family)